MLNVQESAKVDGKEALVDIKLNGKDKDVESVSGKDDEEEQQNDTVENGGHGRLSTLA